LTCVMPLWASPSIRWITSSGVPTIASRSIGSVGCVEVSRVDERL
jgi:hypothetical protein